MATSLAFSNLALSVHSSRPPTPQGTRWSNTRGRGAVQSVSSQYTVGFGVYQI